MDENYSYEQAGFDGFMSRSIDTTPQVTLDSPGPQSNSIAYDRTQISGLIGDTLRIGKIYLNGSQSNITLNNGNEDFLLMGDDGSGS